MPVSPNIFAQIHRCLIQTRIGKTSIYPTNNLIAENMHEQTVATDMHKTIPCR